MFRTFLRAAIWTGDVAAQNLRSHHMVSSRCLSQSTKAAEVLSKIGEGSIYLEKDEQAGIASIVINQPKKKNAISGKMMVDLRHIVEELENWNRGRGILMYGVGDSFCSGGDLDLMRTLAESNHGVLMCQFMQETLQKLQSLPLLSTALVHGSSLGGGSELFTACDFRVVSERVSIGFVQAKMGLVTGWGGGTRLTQLVGRQTALTLLSTAKILSWREAIDIGLADAVIHDTDQEEFVSHGREWLLKHLQGAPEVCRAVKSMVNAVANAQEVEKSLEEERKIFGSVFGKAAHMKALNSLGSTKR